MVWWRVVGIGVFSCPELNLKLRSGGDRPIVNLLLSYYLYM